MYGTIFAASAAMGAVRLFSVLIVNVPSNHSGITFPAPNDSLPPVQCRRRSRRVRLVLYANEILEVVRPRNYSSEFEDRFEHSVATM